MVVGEQDYVRLTALSAGPAAVPSDVVVTADVPEESLAIDPITNNPMPAGVRHGRSTVTCDVASLPPGAPRYVDVPVTPVSPGSGLVVSAKVSTTSVDPDVSNNTLVSSTFDVAANEADLSLTQVFGVGSVDGGRRAGLCAVDGVDVGPGCGAVGCGGDG